jgi:ABC-2 type transport system ATP-binding protein
VISAHSLTKRYGKTVAVDGLSFDVHPGTVTGFLGPNGSGKSTTMRMIMGLDAPESGEALVNGLHYQKLRWPLREVGALLDARAFHPGRTGYDNLRCLAAGSDIPRRRIDEVLDMVGLTSAARQRAGKYSLGMAQRLGIAGALLGDPGVLLFDEPINGLDPEGIRWVRHLLADLAAEGRTVFVSSHLISEMSLTAERLVIIGRGKLIAESTVSELASHEGESVRVVAPGADDFARALRDAGATANVTGDGEITVFGLSSADIGRMAAHRSVTLYELTPVRASLEDAFMELTRDTLVYEAGRRVGPAPAMTRSNETQEVMQ